MRPSWLGAHMTYRMSVVRFAAAFIFLMAALLAIGTDWPLRVRFVLSRPAMERMAIAAKSAGFPNAAPVGMAQRAGLFFVGGVAETTDRYGAIVWVGEPGGHPVMRAVVWYPNGAPAHPSAFSCPIILYDQMASNWYLWDYDMRGR